MLTLDQFSDTIRHGDYRSPKDHLPREPLGRGFRAWWSFFISGLLGAIKKGAALAKAGKLNHREFANLSYSLLNAVESTGCEVSVEGAASLAQLNGRPCVFVANHMSLIETVVLPCALEAFSPISIIAKRSLSKYPGFNKCLASINPILLDRKNARHDLAETLGQGADRLKGGQSVLLFPQGSRMAVFNPRRFNTLGTKLARETGYPLVPVACKTDFVGIGRIVKDLGPVDPSKPVKFAIGPVLNPSLSQSELQQACISFISEKLTEWGVPCEGAVPQE